MSFALIGLGLSRPQFLACKAGRDYRSVLPLGRCSWAWRYRVGGWGKPPASEKRAAPASAILCGLIAASGFTGPVSLAVPLARCPSSRWGSTRRGNPSCRRGRSYADRHGLRRHRWRWPMIAIRGIHDTRFWAPWHHPQRAVHGPGARSAILVFALRWGLRRPDGAPALAGV